MKISPSLLRSKMLLISGYLGIHLLFLWKFVQSITLLDDCKCGFSKSSSVSTRIFGGTETVENAYPWIVYIEVDANRYCGGVLINNLYVLTAGHCVQAMKLNFKVYLNLRDRFSSRPAKLQPIKVIRHPKYKVESTRNIMNDIALIKLNTLVNLDGNTYPICLPHPQSDHSRKTAKILGWGFNENGTTSSILKEADVQIMSNNYCKESMVGKHYQESMICAFSETDDACQGDSGGPLFYKNSDEQHELIGLISWGMKCGTKMPGIYTRITHFMDWIEDNTDDGGYCNV